MRTSLAVGLFSLTSLTSSRSVFARQESQWPDPEPCEGNCTFIHDPHVVRRSDGKWFRYSTLGNIAIASAPALKGPWTYEGAMLPEGAKYIDVVEDQQLWAPDVFVSGGTFYSYYSVSKSGRQDSDIGVATSKTGEFGSWTDHGSVGVPRSGDYNRIDANLFRECGDCDVIWNFGSAWKGVYQTRLNKNLLKWSGDAPRNLLYNSTHPPGQTFPSITEGAFLFWLPMNGQKHYWMFFSSGACCQAKDKLKDPGDEYKIMVCKANSPSGPFKDKNGKDCLSENGGTLVLGSHGEHVYAPGGQGIVIDPDNGDNRYALYYHYADPTIGYEFDKFLFGYNYIDFSSGWPQIVV